MHLPPLLEIPSSGGPLPVALLSLFDGLGTARLAVDELVRIMGGRITLVESWFAEIHPPLHQAVAAAWARRADRFGCVRHIPLVTDVWDLLRHDCAPLRHIVARLPRQAPLLIIGGPPANSSLQLGVVPDAWDWQS